MVMNRRNFLASTGALATGAALLGQGGTAYAATDHLRIAITAAEIPTTTGMPNNGYEGLRFTGYPTFEPLVDWDLSNPGRRPGIRPGLATEWSVDDATKTVWTLKLRENVVFHDGSKLDSDLVVWNFDRMFRTNAPHFDQTGGAILRSYVPWVKSYRAVDKMTVEITTDRPLAYFPWRLTMFLMVGKMAYDQAGSWPAFAKKPAGSGPFRITRVTTNGGVELAPFKEYWDRKRVPRVSKVTLIPMPEATTRLAALRSGQVDWIEVPPPDTVPGLKQAGFNIVLKPYPHVWPWVFSFEDGSPFRDKRVRQALNYAIDRDGLVTLLNGTASPASGYVYPDDVWYGKPAASYRYDVDRAKALLREAGYNERNPLRFKVMISTSGSGQMLPVPMNEFIQQNLAAIGVEVKYEVVEWGTMLVALRAPAGDPKRLGCHALNVSGSFQDPAMWWRFFHKDAAPPVSINWGMWKNAQISAIIDQASRAVDEKQLNVLLARAHEIVVDEAPWLFVVHDLNPRAMSRKVKGFVQARSWFQDFSGITVE